MAITHSNNEYNKYVESLIIYLENNKLIDDFIDKFVYQRIFSEGTKKDCVCLEEIVIFDNKIISDRFSQIKVFIDIKSQNYKFAIEDLCVIKSILKKNTEVVRYIIKYYNIDIQKLILSRELFSLARQIKLDKAKMYELKDQIKKLEHNISINEQKIKKLKM